MVNPSLNQKNPEIFFGVSEKPTVMPFVPVIGNYFTTVVGKTASQPRESSIGKTF
jgi:hypothetical protein